MTETVIIQIIISSTSILLLIVGAVINKSAKKKDKLKKSETPLSQADFHTNIKSLIRKCELMEFEHISEGRVRLIKDYTINKLESFIEPAIKFSEDMETCITNCKGDCNSCNKLLNTAMVMLYDGLKYEETYKELADNKDDLESLMIFNPAFIAWHQPHVDRFSSKIQSICHTPIFSSCSVRAHVILMELDSALFITISESVSASTQLNGKLTGKKYKGLIL